jgi:hypothetical protein
MVNKGLKRAILYFVALLAVSFGMEWGFAYILSAHGVVRRSKKRHAAEASSLGAP